MENSYRIGMSLFPNLNSDRHSDSVRVIQVESQRTSQLYYFYMFVYIQCRRRRPTDRLHLKVPFSRRN